MSFSNSCKTVGSSIVEGTEYDLPSTIQRMVDCKIFPDLDFGNRLTITDRLKQATGLAFFKLNKNPGCQESEVDALRHIKIMFEYIFSKSIQIGARTMESAIPSTRKASLIHMPWV